MTSIRVFRSICYIVLLLVCALPADPQSAPASKLPQIPASCDVFCDVRFAVVESNVGPNGALAVRVAAVQKQETLAFRITFAPGMVSGFLSPQTEMPDLRSVNRGGIRFERTGPESDQFLIALATLYGSKLRPHRMDDEIRFDAYAARGNPSDLKTKPVSFRIFHLPSGGSGAQYEFLLDVDLPKGEVKLREINQDFRDDLIRTLSQPAQD